MKTFYKKYTWLLLLSFLLIGAFYPIIGSVALLCMSAPVIVGIFRGRKWCASACPRGNFHDNILKKFSLNISKPNILKSNTFKSVFLITILSIFLIRITLAWGNFLEVGKIFVSMIFITTLVAIVLGTIFHQRTWCSICPMGTLATYSSKIRKNSSKKAS
jgi:ferredoxin-type protein NapH